MNLFRLDKQRAPIKRIHSLKAELLGSQFLASLDMGDSAMILTRDGFTGVGYDFLHLIDKRNETFQTGELWTIATRVAFDNHGASHKTFLPIGPKEALAKFVKLSGLDVASVQTVKEIEGAERAEAAFTGVTREKLAGRHMTIGNTFNISGLFEVRDPQLFHKAYHEGIGARRSYGFGLLLGRCERVVTMADENRKRVTYLSSEQMPGRVSEGQGSP